MRYENCQYCKELLEKVSQKLFSQGWGDYNKVFEIGYCDKLHEKAHEKQLIKEGKIEGIKPISGIGVLVDTKYRDSRGEQIYFPKTGSYFDRALQRTFHSKKEKWEYMKKNNLIMDGSSDKPNKPIESGDFRFEKVR